MGVGEAGGTDGGKMETTVFKQQLKMIEKLILTITNVAICSVDPNHSVIFGFLSLIKIQED